MTAPTWTSSYAAAVYAGRSTQMLAAWARKGWISRSRFGSVTYYRLSEIDALIESRRERAALPSNITPISAALREARAGFGIRKRNSGT